MSGKSVITSLVPPVDRVVIVGASLAAVVDLLSEDTQTNSKTKGHSAAQETHEVYLIRLYISTIHKMYLKKVS
jgi:hypothetical protein